MRYDELSVEQQEQVHARFSVTLTGNALRDYDYTLTDDGNILSRRYRAELARREQACPYCDGYGAVRVGMNPASVDGMEECICQREQAQAPQHTPGPWGVGYGEDRVITIGPYPCVVADCAPNNELSLEEVAANAALIARAPELLAENEHLRAKLAEGPPQKVHQYKSALANMEQTINDLHRKNDSNNALMTEAAQKIGELRIENARLRSLLAALTQAATAYRDRESSDTYDDLAAASAAAKEAV